MSVHFQPENFARWGSEGVKKKKKKKDNFKIIKTTP